MYMPGMLYPKTTSHIERTANLTAVGIETIKAEKNINCLVCIVISIFESSTYFDHRIFIHRGGECMN